MTQEQQQLIENSQWVINTVLKEMGVQGDEDLKSLANITLCKYIDNYDPSKGVKWTTYAYKCVVMVLKREIGKKYEENSNCISDSRLFYVQDPIDYESQAMANITLDTIMSQLSGKDKYILNARLNDVSFQQIADTLHVSRQSIQVRWRHIRQLCCHYFENNV